MKYFILVSCVLHQFFNHLHNFSKLEPLPYPPFKEQMMNKLSVGSCERLIIKAIN